MRDLCPYGYPGCTDPTAHVHVREPEPDDRAAQAALDVAFSRPCSCPERHAVTGTCQQKAETATAIGGMCIPCACAYQNVDWLGDQPLLAASMPANYRIR